MEEKISFFSQNNRIEGILNTNSTDQGVVITHPHPLYGGNMHNPVVETIANVYQQKGYTTLVFNFRGSGNSQGIYDNGTGEQKDVLAAFSFLENQGINAENLAGYSFGTWINALVEPKCAQIKKMIMVAPPVNMLDFKSITSITSLKYVITGSTDDIAPADIVKKMVIGWNKSAVFEVIDGADHFYSFHIDKLESILVSCL